MKTQSLAISAIFSAAIIVATMTNITDAQIAMTIPPSFSFQTNMQYGDTKFPDVNYLQTFLNQDSRTSLGDSGPGSLNETTSYFGQKTKEAVMRFQQLFAAEILAPAKLSAPNGVFGPLTRSKANKLLSDQRTSLSGLQLPAGLPQNPLLPSGGFGVGSPFVATSNSKSGTSTKSTTGGSSSGGSGISAGGIAAGAGTGIAGGVVGSSLGGLTGGSSGSSGGMGMSTNFAGRITNVTYCTCTANIMLDISQQSGGQISLLYQPGQSTLYERYNIFTPGANVLGNYTQGGGQCEVLDGTECNSQGSPRGNIKMIGTSAI